MLIKDGKVHYARIGIQLAPFDAAIARDLGLEPGARGVFVGGVPPGSPADKAGMKEGDVIIGFGGDKIDDSANSVSGLRQRGSQAVRAQIYP